YYSGRDPYVMLANLFLLGAARDSSCSTKIFPGGPGLYDGLCSGGQTQIVGLNDILVIIGNVIRILVSLAGGVAVIMIIVGGIFYVISSGDPTRIKRAKEILFQAITGLIVIALAYAVVTFIADQF